MSQRKQTGLAICGIGRMGTIHLKNALQNPSVKILYIIEENLEHAKKTMSDNELYEVTLLNCDTADKAFKDPLVEGVIIATPTDKHEQFIKMALKAGKHILCEKPLALELETVINCYKEAKEKGITLLCAFNRRFDPQHRKMHSQKQAVGTIQSIKVCSRDSPKPSLAYLKISGGIFHDCIIHDFDMIRWIVGEDPVTLYTTAHVNDPDIEAMDDVDTVYIVMKFPSGVLAHIDISRYCSYGYDQTVQIYGDSGNLISANPLKTGLIKNGGLERDEIFFSFDSRYADAYKEELAHFVNLIKGKTSTCCIKPCDTLKATMLCCAAEESHRTGKHIVVANYFKEAFGAYIDDPIMNE